MVAARFKRFAVIFDRAKTAGNAYRRSIICGDYLTLGERLADLAADDTSFVLHIYDNRSHAPKMEHKRL